MGAQGAGGVAGEVEHIALAEQLFSAVDVQDGAGVGVGGYAEADAAGEVRLDEAGYDIH